MSLITITVERTSAMSSVTICEVYRGAKAATLSAGLFGELEGATATDQLVNA